MNSDDINGYRHLHAEMNQSYDVLLCTVLRLLGDLFLSVKEKCLFKLGCGNGRMAHETTRRGWNVTGVDLSEGGITQARAAYPDLKVQNGSAYDDLESQYGQ